MDKKDKVLREFLVKSLRGDAHMSFEEAVADFPEEHINTRPSNVDYTFWHLLEHIRRTQIDILDYCKNPKYVEPEWPKDYWPAMDEEATLKQWDETVRAIKDDLQAMIALVTDPKTDLYKPIPLSPVGATVIREAMLVVDHNAYHLGEFAILRQTVNAWPTSHK